MFPNYGYADQLHPLINDHLDIKDAQCVYKNDGRNISDHIILRLGAAAVQKWHFGRPKTQLSSEEGGGGDLHILNYVRGQ